MRKFFSVITALVLCTAMWGGEPKVSQTLYKVEGALYQGLNEKFTGGKNIFVPNDSAVVFTSFDGQPADWYRNNSLQEGGEGTPSFKFQKSFNDYAPIQIRNYTGYGQNATKTKIDYIYGKAAYNGTTLSVGTSTMNMMSMANGYYYRTEDSATTSNIGLCYIDNMTASGAESYKTKYGTYMTYGTKFTYEKYGGLVDAYEMLLDNPGEMYIDYIVLPIFGYPKTAETTIEKMIPDGKTVTLKLYPLSTISKDADGKYSYKKESAPVATMTVNNKAYTKDVSKAEYGYRGTLKFVLDEPVLMTTSFVAELTWDDGCDFGLITDNYNLQNYTTWYIWKNAKYFFWSGGGHNASISYHATFPTLDKKDTKTAFNFASTGGSDNIAFRSNIDPAKTEDFTIDLGEADWISMTGITYSGGTYKKSGTNTLTFAVEANEGEARETTITLKHHGKVLTYTVSQEAAPAPVSTKKIIYCKMEQGWWKADGAAVGCHSWGTPGPGTTWPGVRMVPVAGQTDLWSIELDTEKVQNVIFTRVNASGDIADWGAKTKDLTIPTDDKNLFTITSTTAVWGDPGCDGEWSVYVPTVQKYYVTGNAALVGKDKEWAANAIELKDGSYTFEKLAAGDYQMKVTQGDWEKASYGFAALSKESSKNIYDADGNIRFILAEEGDVTVAFADEKVTVTGTFVPATTTYSVEVPEETPNCFIAGSFNKWTFQPMNKVDETHYTLTLEGEFQDSVYKYTCGKDWKYVEVIADNRTYSKSDEVSEWTRVPGDKYSDIYSTDSLDVVGDKVVKASIVCYGDTFPAYKVGTSTKDTRVCTITVPAGTKNLHLHAAGWQGKNVTLTITGVAKQEITLSNDNAVSGDIKTTTVLKLEGDPESFYKVIEVNAAAETTITITGSERYLLFGANAEGGYVAPKYYIAGSMTKWAKDMVLLEEVGKDSLSAKIDLEADSLYQFKVVKVQDKDTTWYGMNEAATMELGNSTGWWLYTSVGEANQANVGLRTTTDSSYIFYVNLEVKDHVGEPVVSVVIPEPPVTYYLKNNWDMAGDWSWKEMKADEEGYVLDSVVFGGTGVNLNTAESDNNAKWFDLKSLKYNDEDTIQALDTVRFELAISEKDTVLTAIVLARPTPPCTPNFGVMVDDTVYQKGTFNETDNQWEVKGVSLTEDQALTLYNLCEETAFMPKAGNFGEVFDVDAKAMIVKETAIYDFYIKLIADADELWVVKHNVEVLPMITEAPKSWAGEYVITAMKDENTALVWTGVDAGQCRVETPVVEGEVTMTDPVKVIVEAMNGGGYSIKVKGGTNDGKYMTQKATPAYGNALSFVDTPVRVDIEMNKDGLVDIYQTINATQKVYLLYNAQAGTTNERFRFYKDSNHGGANYKSLTLFGTVAPVMNYDTTMYVAGNFTDWQNEMIELPAKVDFPADSTLEFKQVRVITTTDEGGKVVKQDTTWYGQAGEGNFMTRESNAWLLDGTNNVFAKTDVEGTYTFSINEKGEFVITWPITYYLKNNWDNGEWSWKEMKADEEGYVLDSVVFGGTGVNLNTAKSDEGAKWFDLKSLKYNEQDTIQALDTVRFELAISEKDTVLTAILLGRPAPVARKEFVFVAGAAADSDPAMFAITWGKDGSSEQVKMEKQEEALYAADILATVDSVVLVRCATGATEIIWGEGTNVWNQTANYALCDTMYFGEWTEEGLFTLTCEAPKPVETKYYAKNNWNGAASEDWSWLEMSATTQENVYMLDSVVFGGTGVNINDKEDDTDALWFAADAITVLDGLDGLPGPIPPKPQGRDTIPYAPAHSGVVLEAPQLLAGDTIKLFFNAADSTLKAAIVGRPEQPQPVGTFDLTIVQDTVWSKDGAKIAAWIWGEELAGQWTSWATNNNDTLTLKVDTRADSIIFKRFAPEVEVPYWEGTAEYQWNEIAKSEIEDCHLFIITNWNEGVWCERPQPAEVKYYVTGNAALVGEDNAWNAQAIEMIDSTYTFTELAVGEYEMKITNGAWDPEGQSWGSAALSEECSAGVGDKNGNIHFIVETANDVTVSIANGSVTVTGTFKQVATGITVNVTVPEGTPACFFYGEMSGNTFVEMTKVDETHYTIDFPKATTIGWGYKFVWENGNWSTCNADPEGDIKIEPVNGVITVEVKAWATAPGTEYKYTTYTEWQVKFGPAWEWVNMTKQEDGIFTVEAVWGNTGINIASGENPIKKDWYPLDDPALTVEEGVVEGGNVVITLTVVDDETVALNVKKGQEPATPDFGLLVNGTDYLAGQPEDKGEYTEYAVNTTLAIGDFVQLYDNVNKAAWTVTPEGEGFTDFDIHDGAYYIKQAGLYQFYIKIPKHGMESGLYVGFQGSGTNLNNLKALDGKRYNILGQPVNETYRGIVIMNGQTYLQ